MHQYTHLHLLDAFIMCYYYRKKDTFINACQILICYSQSERERERTGKTLTAKSRLVCERRRERILGESARLGHQSAKTKAIKSLI